MKNISFVTVVAAKTAIVQSYRITSMVTAASKEEREEMVVIEDSVIKKIHGNQIKFTNIMAVVLVSCSYITGIIYITDGLYRIYSFYEANPNVKPTDPKPHCVLFWFPVNKDVYYKMSMVYEMFHIFQTLNYNGAAQTVVCSMMVFLKTELKILQHNVSSIKYSNDSNIEDILKGYSKKHQELIKWVKDFNISFQYIILLEYSVISVTLATILIGIVQSSSNLTDAIYFCPWYEFDETSKYLVLFMLLKCKKPLTIANGPFGYLTMEAAASRIKLSYTVVSVFST
ncbi:uncharacterized protein [Euwallacea similis]|uniref:uncharacterized protein n=1 Tax=Euwallacea similis TaxID=1736056 RepID=UPI00344E7301